MGPPARVFAPDKTEIHTLEEWHAHAAPQDGEAHWRDGYSEKEQARAWLRDGSPSVPEELWAALAPLVPSEAEPDELFVRPEHPTPLDGPGHPHRLDLFGCARRDKETLLVIGVAAKGCEDFGALVSEHAHGPSPGPERCNLLSRALFGRPVCDEESGEILDHRLAGHGYDLWTAAVGTILEAQSRDVPEAVLVEQQFTHPGDSPPKDPEGRDWGIAAARNHDAWDRFAAAFTDAGGVSHETSLVKAGTHLHLVRVVTEF